MCRVCSFACRVHSWLWSRVVLCMCNDWCLAVRNLLFYELLHGTGAVNGLKYLIAINCTLFICIKCIFKGYFSSLTYQHGWGQICLLYANVCLLLLQQFKTMTGAQLAIQETLVFIHFCLRSVVSAATYTYNIYCSLAFWFPKLQGGPSVITLLRGSCVYVLLSH